VAKDSVSIMQSRYGSHVLRSLLCLCKGVPPDQLDKFHVTKKSDVLAARLNSGPSKLSGVEIRNEFENRFESVFRFLVREMADSMKDDMTKLRVDQFSSFVLQVHVYIFMSFYLLFQFCSSHFLSCHFIKNIS
jgi:nucleolar protein 9